MKKLYIILLSIVLAVFVAFGVVSAVDTDATVSKLENKKLAQKPVFTVERLLDGSYISDFETYFSETFPLRDAMLRINRALNSFYYFSGASDENLLIISGTTGAESGGESLADASTMAEEIIGEQAPEQLQTPAEEQQPDAIETAVPSEDQASYAGNVVVVGTRAMEIPTINEDTIVNYGTAVGNLASAMPENVRTFSLIAPNSGEFYSPESMHTGIHSQKEMIDLCYASMPESVKKVDAYSELAKHTDEYLYFRTDHHWTQLGAYYAYTKFCECAGFEPAALDQFETATYDYFLGSMYTFTSGYPQSETLKQNPDSLQYYLPIVETHAKYYEDAQLINGIPISVVYTSMDPNFQNKYLCYIGGDTPICIIETAAEGGTCIVLKESYGNAFVPFLTSHYSKIIVIDPREFNRQDLPHLDLRVFAAEQGVDDLIVINYPYMINSDNFVNWLNRLVGADPNWTW